MDEHTTRSAFVCNNRDDDTEFCDDNLEETSKEQDKDETLIAQMTCLAEQLKDVKNFK